MMNMARRQHPYKKTYEKKAYEKGPNQYGRQYRPRDDSITCKVCNGRRHCATREDTICYALAKNTYVHKIYGGREQQANCTREYS